MPISFEHVHLKNENGKMVIDENSKTACSVCIQNIKEDHANKIFRFYEYGDSQIRNKDGSIKE